MRLFHNFGLLFDIQYLLERASPPVEKATMFCLHYRQYIRIHENDTGGNAESPTFSVFHAVVAKCLKIIDSSETFYKDTVPHVYTTVHTRDA